MLFQTNIITGYVILMGQLNTLYSELERITLFEIDLYEKVFKTYWMTMERLVN